jgi:hypothetical protein
MKKAGRLKYEITPGAKHSEQAWAERLPRALTFLCSDWKQQWEQEQEQVTSEESPGS